MNDYDHIKRYLNNPNLKSVNQKIDYTPEQIQELSKCADKKSGYLYFVSNYFKVVNVDYGLIQFTPRNYQVRMLDTMHNNTRTLIKSGRQSGKSICVAAYMLWCLLFLSYYKIAVLANKETSAKNILKNVKMGYEKIPIWMQQGVEEWNKTSICLENQSSIITAATSESGIRGDTANFLYLDEFAHVEEHIAHPFFKSVFPVISSGKTSKCVISSTPKGLNYFYKLWKNSEKNKNQYKRVEVKWNEPPGRDEKWKQQVIDEHGEENFRQEYACITGDSKITVRDIETGEIKTIDIENVYNEL